MKKIMNTYEVFARQQRQDPLKNVGNVTAPNEDLAAMYARSIYDEEAWIEMRIVQRENLVPAINLKGSVTE